MKGDLRLLRRKLSDFRRPLRRFCDAPAPLCLEAMNWERVVVVLAHPDDETFCSGLLSMMTEKGAEITAICLTRGEGGPANGIDRDSLGRVREGEMRAACQVLGVSQLIFLNHIDPLARYRRVYAPNVSVSELANQIETDLRKAGLVISHGSNGEYWHPGHLLVHDAVKTALARPPSYRPDWLTFMARHPNHPLSGLINWDDEAAFSIDVAERRIIRETALSCHTTQLPLFGRVAGGNYQDFVQKTGVESYRFYPGSHLSRHYLKLDREAVPRQVDSRG